MAFNAYLLFKTSGDPKILGESTSDIANGKGAIEVTDYGFGVYAGDHFPQRWRWRNRGPRQFRRVHLQQKH
jgi:hypothetical protein